MRRRIRDIHFVGIGGVGMSGLAELLVRQGYRISGSDQQDSPALERLRGLGVEVSVGHDQVQVGAAQVVVVSSAIRPDNPEIVAARAQKIPVIGRAEMLAEMMRLQDGIAVGGSHGKTTTTSLIAHVLSSAGLDPTAVIGGRVLGGHEQSGARLGQGGLMVAEADESDGSFLRLSPVISIVTNIDPEHLDHYGDFAALQDAFVDFANRVPFWGLAVVCLDHPGVQAILPRIARRVCSYGFSSQADWVAGEPRLEGGQTRFAVSHQGRDLGEVGLPIPGRHNVQNALAALAVADELEVDFDAAREALASFAGVARRFERKGEARGVTVIDDYAHHPAEVRATLAAARSVHPGRVVAVFQPHRYTRTRDCMDEFATAFNDCQRLLISEIYAAGDDPIPGIEGRTLADKIRDHGHRDVVFVPGLEAIADRLAKELEPGDWLLTLGAGDVSRLGPMVLERLDQGAGT